MNVIKITLTSCQIFRLKCTKFGNPKPNWESLYKYIPQTHNWIEGRAKEKGEGG